MTRAIRYQAAIIRGKEILLIRHLEHESGRTYWLLPGGGIEAGETEIQCIKREVYEETCLEVGVERLLLDEPNQRDTEIYQRFKTYLCRIQTGEAQPGFEPEPEASAVYAIVDIGWVDLYDEATWNSLIVKDPITAPLLRRVRFALEQAT